MHRVQGDQERRDAALGGAAAIRQHRSMKADEIELCSRSLPEVFREVASARMNEIAIAGDESSTTYDELDVNSDQVAAGLVAERGDGSEVVGLLVEGFDAYVTALLGVLKAGKVAMPIDMSAPTAFRDRLLDDAGASLVLTNVCGGTGENPGGTVRDVAAYLNSPVGGPPVHIPAHYPAVLHYTSGSTGQPKALAWPHTTCVYHGTVIRTFAGVSPRARFGLLTPPSFAISTMQIAVTLLSGGILCYYPASERGLAELPEWLNANRVSASLLVTTAMRGLVASGKKIPSLRHLVVSSEPVLRSDVEGAFAAFGPDLSVVHAYGASEAGWITAHEMRGVSDIAADPAPSAPVPIGLALPGRSVWLDAGVPAGSPDVGEIVASSSYLPRAQSLPGAELVRRNLEAGATDHEAMYRTGDLAERRADGQLLLRGRLAHMVKMRGTRVDLAMLERELTAQETVLRAAVVPRHGPRGQTLIRAMVVPDQGFALEPLKDALRASLPPAMMPTEILVADQIPLLANGKPDLQSIAAIDDQHPTDGASGLPASGLEVSLAEIWSQVLEHRVSADDDFFELGGDSLAALELILAIEEQLGCEVRGADLLTAPTVRELAVLIRSRPGTGARLPVPIVANAGGEERLFFVPPLGGSLLQLRPLASALADDVSIYGVPAWDRETAAPTVPAEAQVLVDGIRSRQPAGPYWLGGHSGGGVLALEMARVLESQGERVGGLIILDSVLGSRIRPPVAPRPSINGLNADRLTERVPAYLRLLRHPLSALEMGFVRLGLGHHVDRAVWSLDLRRRGKVRAYRRNRYLWAMELAALDSYSPGPCRAPVTLLRSPDKPDPAVEETWRRLALGGLTVRYVDVPHDELLAAQYIDTIAPLVRAAQQSAPISSARGGG